MMDELIKRGLINDMTNRSKMEQALDGGATIYCGFDCTASSLHVGNLVALAMLREFSKTHSVIAVIGTATTLIGDPSGKTSSRPMLDRETVERNALGIEKSIRSVLGDDVTILRNGDWILDVNLVDFLREIGSRISINRLLTLDSVKSRLDAGMSYLEFTYSLIQAYDHLHLTTQYGPVVQIGGSDQFGNITISCEVTRKVSGIDGHGITTPLLTKSNGEKMGKSVNGAVWLNEDQLSVEDFWQFWRNVSDDDVDRFSGIFLGKEFDGDINERKILLADGISALVHGGEKTHMVSRLIQQRFTGDAATYREIACRNMDVISAMMMTGVVESKSHARRLIDGKAVKNGDVVTSYDHKMKPGTFTIGKKNFYTVV